MQILVPIPLKPLVLVWGLLTGMMLIGFLASSMVQGKDPFMPGPTTIGRHSHEKNEAAVPERQPKRLQQRSRSASK